MTSIAWAIVFVALIFYERLYHVEIEAKSLGDTLGSLTMISLAVLILCTIRELIK